MSLFRKEAIDAQRDRLHGDVVIYQTFPARMLGLIIFSVVVIAAVWLSMGTYARVETVPGLLITDAPSAKVVSPQGGVIVDLAVKEGGRVERGERLAIISTDRRATAGGAVVERRLESIRAQRKLSAAQIALAADRAAAERSRLIAYANAAKGRVAGLREQIELQEQVVASNQQMFSRVSEVVKRGFVSQVELEQRRQRLLSSRQQLADLRQRLISSEADISQTEARIVELSFESAQGISQIENGLQGLLSEEARLQGERGFELVAPIGGRVTALTAGLGRSVSPGRPLMTIVPEGSELLAELYAPSRAIGFVRPGKEARLLYDAFPYERFGSFRGTIASISRTAVDPRETEIPLVFEGPVYRVRVKLQNQQVGSDGGYQALLQPGMTLQANLVLERQSFLDWLLQPLNSVLNRSS